MDMSTTDASSTTADAQNHDHLLLPLVVQPSSTKKRTVDVIHAWQAAEHQVQTRHASMLPKFQSMCGPTALVMMLAPVNVKSAVSGGAPLPSAGGGGGDAADFSAEKNSSTRITFFVIKMLSPGWSSVPAQGGGGGGGGKKGGNNANNGKNNNNNKGPTDKLSEAFGEHVLMHSYQLLKKGGYSRGPRSSECLALSPGMVFTLKAWSKNVAIIFKEQTENINPFELAVVQFSIRSTSSEKVDEMVEIKSINTIPCVSVSSFRLVQPELLPGSMQQAAVMRSRYADGTYLQQHYQELVDTKGLKQDWLKNNLSSTVSVVVLNSSASGISSGTFAVGPDNVLRFHLEGGSTLADLPLMTSGTLLIHYDCSLYQGAPRDWVVGLFNVALSMNSMELLVAVDTYEGGSSDKEQIVNAFARINVSSITAAMLRLASGVTEAPPPAKIISAFEEQGTPRKHITVYAFADNKLHLAIDTRKVSKRASGNNPEAGFTTIKHVDAEWSKGHNAYVFSDARLVFHFVALVDIADDSGCNGGGGGPGCLRGLKTIALPSATAFSIVDEEEDAYEEDEYNNNNNNATPTIMASLSEEQPQLEEQEETTTTTTTTTTAIKQEEEAGIMHLKLVRSDSGSVSPAASKPPTAAAAAAAAGGKKKTPDSNNNNNKRKRQQPEEESSSN